MQSRKADIHDKGRLFCCYGAWCQLLRPGLYRRDGCYVDDIINRATP